VAEKTKKNVMIIPEQPLSINRVTKNGKFLVDPMQPSPQKPHPKRTKELTIADIIEKVSLWRKLYNGVVRNGTLVRYSLDDAAKKVEV
jgi:hypothetical protein